MNARESPADVTQRTLAAFNETAAFLRAHAATLDSHIIHVQTPSVAVHEPKIESVDAFARICTMTLLHPLDCECPQVRP